MFFLILAATYWLKLHLFLLLKTADHILWEEYEPRFLKKHLQIQSFLHFLVTKLA